MKTDKESRVFKTAFAFIILAVAFLVSAMRVKERLYAVGNEEIKEVFSQSGGNGMDEKTKWNDTFYDLFEK